VDYLRNSQSATADDIAKIANVSRVAVSRAFNPSASIKPEKRALILKLAQELNYVPNHAARSLVTKRSHLVGVIVPDVCSPWESQEIDALTTSLQSEGFATLLFKTRADKQIDPQLLSYISGFNPDSVIVFVENVRRETLAKVIGRAVPIYVEYDNQTPLANDEGAGMLYDRLNICQRQGMEQAVALLHGFDCKRIAFLDGHPRSLAARERKRALSQIMAGRGMAPPIIVPGDFTYDSAHAAILSQFRVDNGVDAIFAANDVSAFGAIDALRYSLGLRVPKDVKVIGFDNITQAKWRAYDLTTVKVDLRERVDALIRLILRRLKTPDAPILIESLSTSLVVRGSVG